MSTGFENQERIAKLPQEGVHCFAANTKQVKNRRIVTVPLMIIFLALGIYMLVSKSYAIGACSLVAFVIFLLVFIQSFLIANYRVAVDYNEKRIVLRYRFSLITIPFENFDAHIGAPDRAEEMLASMNHVAVKYLVLDNVFEDACYQTSTKDLASSSDFDQLMKEAFDIAEAYGAKYCDGVIKPDASLGYDAKSAEGKDDELDVDSIVADALNLDESQVKELAGDNIPEAEQ